METKEQDLIKEIETKLPEFAKSVHFCKKEADILVLHQDAFAADYQDEEYSLLGKAIKFAGIHGVNISIHRINRETINKS